MAIQNKEAFDAMYVGIGYLSRAFEADSIVSQTAHTAFTSTAGSNHERSQKAFKAVKEYIANYCSTTELDPVAEAMPEEAMPRPATEPLEQVPEYCRSEEVMSYVANWICEGELGGEFEKVRC